MGNPEQQSQIAHFVAMCDHAADQIAAACKALHQPAENVERAMTKLDEALDYLRGCDARA